MIAGRIVVSELVRLCVKRHANDLKNAGRRGYHFDRDAGQHVISFFSFLHHSKGEWSGSTFELSPWQQFLLWVLFGWKRKDDTRRFREAYNEIARKNGKSTLAAGVGLYLTAADGEPGAEVYSAATKKDQARIVWSEAVRMVKASPHLQKRLKCFRDNIHIPGTASKFEPLGADEDTLDGLNIHGALIDELHAHRNRKVFEVLDTATGARRNPLIFTITTAGYDRQSICWEKRNYAEKVLRGIIQDDRFFAFVSGIDDSDDWEDEENWPKANPNLHVSVKIDDLRSKATKAKETPASLNSFLRLHLNKWTSQHTAWMAMDKWDLCAAPVNEDELRGRECFLGLDLASTTDIAAAVMLFPPSDEEERWQVVPRFWVPEENIEQRANKDRVPYAAWVDKGLITATEGNVIDYDVIRRDIVELGEIYNIREIPHDRWNAQQICTQLMGDGFEMVAFGQGFASMAAPTKRLMELVLSEQLQHGGNEVMRWMASNMTVKTDPAGNLKPDKAKSTEKIDGMVALIMALGRASASNLEDSPYSHRGVLMI